MAAERVIPNAVTAQSGVWVGAATDIDEDVGGPYDDALRYTEDGGPVVDKIDFATPLDTPTAVTNDQQISIAATKWDPGVGEDGGGGDPLFTLTVYDGSSEVVLVTDQLISAADQVYSYTFTYNGGGDGSEVYVLFSQTKGGGGPNLRTGAIEAIEWNAETGVAAPPDFVPRCMFY